LIESEILIGLPGYQITGIDWSKGKVTISARYSGPRCCGNCGSAAVRSRGLYHRTVRHEDWGLRHCFLEVEAQKLKCLSCGQQWRPQLPGILPRQRASEAFQQAVYEQHLDGINRSRLGRREGIGAATVERYFRHRLQRQFRQWHPPRCPTVLGIDEHFFTRRHGYATTFCDLRNHKVYDVVLGRSEAALEAWLQKLEGKTEVRVVCMDLASVYRALVRRHFPNARIVADRFHVIRIINQHFLACWKQIDALGSRNRGLLSLMRRHRHNLRAEQQVRLEAYLAQHPVLELIYRFKQRLCYLLLKKHRTRKQCAQLVPRFLRAVYQLRQARLPQLVQLGDTLHAWREEIATMWRFSRNNAITEGFHNKMELISRQAYGFRNFQNYRMRVKVLCA
jgi:transposase